MEKLPANTELAISSYAPIRAEGLILYPVRVRDWDAYGPARAAISFLQQSLPVALLSVPLLQAYYTLYLKAAALTDAEKQSSAGLEALALGSLFYGAVCHMILSLRLHEALPIEQRIQTVQIEPSAKDRTRLERLHFWINGEEEYTVSPIQFQRLRPILAAQNGVALEAVDANPEIVAMERRMQEEKAADVDFSIHKLVAAVATLTGTEEAVIYEWPILKLNRRAEAYSRVMDYVAVTIGQSSGLVSYKDGLPVPSPWFAKRSNGLLSLTKTDKLPEQVTQTKAEQTLPPEAMAFFQQHSNGMR